MNILGITLGHDAAACLLADGKILADVAEERLTRIKHDSAFPARAITTCLRLGGIAAEEIDVLALPSRSIGAGLEARFVLSPAQAAALARERPIDSRLRGLVLGGKSAQTPTYFERFALSPGCRLHFTDHHLAHAAAAHYTRGSSEPALIVTMDGIGDGVSIG
ncbi:MAG: hypothetical protein KIT16_06940, partial [Rhodospirillaceae bacterium]|nr:hypothetical protein [Rhodospirillaceae bacterium]